MEDVRRVVQEEARQRGERARLERVEGELREDGTERRKERDDQVGRNDDERDEGRTWLQEASSLLKDVFGDFGVDLRLLDVVQFLERVEQSHELPHLVGRRVRHVGRKTS
jgi:hypothetical protein